ncbi:MAG: hydrogenase formation protein HypD [Planctomycetes bacterium]|nr:hydrogenase formation protein HypD [Planctomycetota bacterium]
MKYLDEYRDAELARSVAEGIGRLVTRPWTLMEICGGQTHSILRHGLDRMLPEGVRLLHGPGCPVCVTPAAILDLAVELALRHEVVLCSFGDMLRVPGRVGDLLSARAAGAEVVTVYSPLDAVTIAARRPDRQVVFLAVGFETTAPANAMAVLQAERLGLDNFSLLCSQVLVPPAMATILEAADNQVQGFLAAGHVCTITGEAEYHDLARRYRVPIVITGFEPVDILQGCLMCLRQLEEGRHQLENQYARSVRREGNALAREAMARVFRVIDRDWRGIGRIPRSGLGLREDYLRFDAERRFEISVATDEDEGPCIAGRLLRGLGLPTDCDAFGRDCRPEHPLGAPMVSSEGACAAYLRYRGGEES